jgi:DNA-binding IclR family transcriptional regulator
MVHLGAVMPLLASAGGRVFAAYLDRTSIKWLIQEALADPETQRAGIHSVQDADTMLDTVRRVGFAAIAGTVHPGIAAISAPVFDYTDGIVAALTLVEIEGVLDLSMDGPPVRRLKAAAAALSWRLGARMSERTGATIQNASR